jgi:uncharacterized protein YlxW (UPF0749 family)
MANVVNKKTKKININKTKPLSSENKKKKVIAIKTVLAKMKFPELKANFKKYNILTYLMMGISLFVLSLIISAQLNTVGNTNIIGKGMREAELLAELSKSNTEYDNLKTDYDKSQEIVDEYKSSQSNTSLLVSSMKEELDKANILAGLVDLEGEGVLKL